MQSLVSTEWVFKNREAEQLVLLDVSPTKTAKGKVSALQELTIPHARIGDLKQHFSDEASPYPNTVPSAQHFNRSCQALGINQDANIVVFDNLGIYTSPRIWWLFKTMGHTKVAVLDGGLPAWVKMGFPTIRREDISHHYKPGNFEGSRRDENIMTYQNVVDNETSQDFLLVDGRSSGRFQGTDPEPRKHLKSGHIPNSINLPYQQLLENGQYKSPQVLRDTFNQCGIHDTTNNLVFSCGSGVTACIVMLGYEIAYGPSHKLYDGSWTEYAEKEGLLVQSEN